MIYCSYRCAWVEQKCDAASLMKQRGGTSMKTTVTAVDFGTSKIVALMAENSGTQRCDIIGAGIAPYDGFLDEGWNNPGELNDAIQAALTDAEEQSKKKIREVDVGVPGAFTRIFATEVTLELKGADPHVTAADVNACFRMAREAVENQPGVVIHSSPAWFMVDDGKKTLEPVTAKGRTLHAMISFVMANEYFIDDVTKHFVDMGIKVNGFYSTAAGEALLYLPEEDRDRTAVLIDIGYLNTEVMVVEGDALLFHKCIDIGGGHIAADLSAGLDISLKAAEHLKRQFVYGIATANDSYEVPAKDGEKPMSFTKEQVAEIAEPRVDEIAEEIVNAIDDAGVKLGNWSNVYLTGGGLSFNHGGRDYLAGRLGRPVRDVPKRTTKLNSQAFSSTLGLMDLIIDTMEQHQNVSGFGGRIKEFFRGLMGD